MNARFLELEITGTCHHRCRHCYGSFPREGELDKRTVMRLIDEAGAYFDALIFSGGEPFLHPDLIALTRHARDSVVFITTTGCGLGREQLEKLPGNAVLVFGLDGIGEVHDYYRGKPGAYTHLLQSLEMTRDRPREIIATLWKGMLHQIDDIIALAERYRVILHFNAVIPVGRARSNREMLPDRQEHEAVYEKLQRLRMERGASLVTDLYKMSEKDLGGIDLFCKGRFSVAPSGDVRPCEFHPGVLGNIFEEPLSRILERAKEHPFIRARESGFRDRVRLDVPNPFDYHTEICHPLAAESGLFLPR